MNEPILEERHDEPEPHRPGFWQKLGGGALTFAIIAHLIALVLGAFWIFQVIREPGKPDYFIPQRGGDGESRAKSDTRKNEERRITPCTNVKRVFAKGTESTFTIPDPGDHFSKISAMPSLYKDPSVWPGWSGSDGRRGKDNGVDPDLDPNAVSSRLFSLIPETMGQRCSPIDRAKRLEETGGTPACEQAVVKGLRWLKANQAADGSWGTSNKAAMTGLALLAYFGHCETPASEEFGASCLKGIVYLVDIGMKNNGRLGGNPAAQPFCYQHAIATYALGEAATFCKEIKQDVPNLMEVTEKAGQFIIDSQHKNGGWAYNYVKEGGHTDLSIVGWQIQALKACSHSKLSFRGMSTCINKGLNYVNDLQDKKSGGFGYNSPAPHAGHFTLTGVGMLCNQMWDKGSRSEVTKGAKWIVNNSKFVYNSLDGDLYGHYYESQAMMQRGGKDWDFYNNMFRDQVLNNQDTDGSWKPPGVGGKTKAPGGNFYAGAGLEAKVYRTCLCTLMLEVYYRFLNTGGGGMRQRTGI